MTKKHFIALADVMRNLEPAFTDGSISSTARTIALIKHETWSGIKYALADFCQSQNPQFDRERWLGYIAGENGPNGSNKMIRCTQKTFPGCGCKGFHSDGGKTK